jgi:predicted DNA-binding transcriptional regulator YafY
MTAQEITRLVRKHTLRVLKMTYKGAEDDATRTRYVRPYEIREESKHTYLFATIHEGSATAIRKFRLDRIQTLEPTVLVYKPEWPVEF